MIDKNFLVLISSFWLLSCGGENKNPLSHEIVIKDILTFSVPNQMKFLEGKGIDSYVAYLLNYSGDSILVEYGNRGIVNNLYYVLPPVFPLSQRGSIIRKAGKEPSRDEVLFSEFPDEDRGQNIYGKNYFLYDTINEIVVKIVQPKRIGKGITGLYIPKLRNGKAFSIYGQNLDSLTHLTLLNVFHSIRYQ